MHYLSLDIEKGGVSEECSLLTLYMCVCNDQFKILDELDLSCKPDNELYTITVQGMFVNQIDLQEHDKIAIKYKECKPLVYNFLQRNYKRDSTLLLPFGQGIGGDIKTLQRLLISEGSWEQFCSHASVDLLSLTKACQILGYIPWDQSLALSAICDWLKIPININMIHTAKYDTQLNILLMKKLLKILGKHI